MALVLTVAGVTSCSQDILPTDEPTDAENMEMKLVMSHPAQKVDATATDFEEGDKVGIFVTQADKPLQLGGNVVNNEAMTFSGNGWTAARTLYWDDGKDNVYAYYPYINSLSSIEDQPFSVSLDQTTEKTATAPGGYEASDLLFATSKNIKASDSPVSLTFKHIMSKLKIRLIKGEDFEGDMPTDAKVYVHGTVPTATIDLQAGVATRYVKGSRQTIIAHQDGDTSFSAIIVPQRIDNRQPFIEVVMKGVSYLYESKFQFKPGTEHLVNLIISNNPDQVKINIGGEIKDWK